MSRNQTKFIPKNHPPNPRPASERFVNYLPQDDAVSTGLGAEEGGLDVIESQRVVDVLNRELSRLLRLKPGEFWKEVVSDTSLHEFLDSFLKFRSRWYDLSYRGAEGVVAGVIVDHRIETQVHGLPMLSMQKITKEKKLLDLPKLLDICAVYGHENANLTRTLVSNAFKAQPWMYESLTNLISHFLNIIQIMQQRCHSSIEFLFSSGSGEEAEFSRLCSVFLEVYQKSKADVPDTDILDSRDVKDSARVSALVSQYEYEDEYDDSFDELELGVESRFEESEEMGDRVNLTMGKSRDAETEASSSLADTGSSKWGSRKKPQYYVKDGKNYSYKVEGATAVANTNEAKLMNQALSQLIHGLGRGDNIPLGAVRKLAESQEQEKQPVDFESEGRGRGWDGGRVRGGRHGDSHGDQGNNGKASEGEGRGIIPGDQRGRGRGRGGRSNHYRKDRAINKHLSGVSGF